jgi:hypothetical protein
MFCKKEGKWTEVLYIQLFFSKRPPKMADQMQARYLDYADPLQKLPNSLEEPEQKNHLMPKGPP